MVRTLLAEMNETELLEKFEKSVMTSYIDDNANMRWCPSIPHCGRAVEVLGDGYIELACTCGKAFCFKCGSDAHSPATCKMWKDWQLKLSDDSETLTYLQVHFSEAHRRCVSATLHRRLPVPGSDTDPGLPVAGAFQALPKVRSSSGKERGLQSGRLPFVPPTFLLALRCKDRDSAHVGAHRGAHLRGVESEGR